MFEIEDSTNPADPGANIVTDDAGNIDWAEMDGDPTPGRIVVDDMDITIGNKTDDSAFGQGTSEDTEPPSVVAGGVPPNKSDLKKFGVYVEEDGDTFVNVFWTRVQDPSGTTNMDFEFNQSSSPSANNVTPIRTAGDLLLQYDLANGGTNPELFLSEWITQASAGGASAASVCEATNKFPCWGIKQNLSDANLAAGSINNDPISNADAGGLDEGMGFDERTFGEAQFNLTGIVGAEECITFGSVYLKSRSSDSFTAALKDFIPPVATSITNCAAVKVVKKDDNGSLLNGATFTLYQDNEPVGTFGEEDSVVLDGGGDPVACTTGIPLDGECQINDILAGLYCLDETGVPANHIPADPQCFEVDPSVPVLTLMFTDRQLGSILVKKADEDGAALDGAEFKVIAANPADDDVPTLPVTLTEAPTGFHCVDGLPIRDALGTVISYTVSETMIPPGYFGASDAETSAEFDTCANRTVEPIDDADVDLIFVNERKPGAIKITKTTKDINSELNPVPHPGVTFNISNAEGVVGSVVTDANGEACLDELEFGEIFSVDEVTPVGYEGESAKNVEIDNDAVCGSGNEETVSFHNTPLGKFTISYESLPMDGHGATKATVTCTGEGVGTVIAEVDLFDGDSQASSELNFETQATYTCTIVVDP
ncbi:MSCRAMM family protein [Marinobacterium aestuariivivens]|uniref:Collagen binding domain-containing protein n=1 Tax=Marinobacterium aestuariivivens TaxID=1698799 RepID=A0ABW1ZTZ4_9GAMM